MDSEFFLGYFKYIDYRRTPDPKVKKLSPGHFLSFVRGRHSTDQILVSGKDQD